MENKEAPRIVSCDECKFEWPYGKTKMIEKCWIDENEGLTFMTLSFSCPECGKEYLVCVDNEITLTEKEEILRLQKQIQRIVRFLQSGNMSMYHMLAIQRERLMVRISNHQEKLREAYLERVQKGLLKETKNKTSW